MLTPRELATVLAALRHWQLDHLKMAPSRDSEHFTEQAPLTLDEIDRLCERLNFACCQQSS